MEKNTSETSKWRPAKVTNLVGLKIMSDRVSSKEVHFHCFGKMDKLNFQEELTTQLEEQKSNGKIR
jgi:hypothetical protein